MGREFSEDPAKAVLREFRKRWRERYGSPSCYTPNARARARTREVVEALGAGEVLRRVRAYVEDGSEWVASRRHPYPAFLAMVDNYSGGSRDGKGKIARRESFDAGEETAKARSKPEV